MTTIALTPEGEAFLARVRDELADLPPDERDELLEDIESHIAELSGEGGVPLAVRLGSAEEFAQELRHSAGLPPRSEPTSASRLDATREGIDGALRRSAALRAQVDAALVWRLARGWLLAVAFAVAIGWIGDTRVWSIKHVWLPHAGLQGYGAILAVAAFVALSLWLGRRAATGRGVRLDRVASALALIAIVPAVVHLDSPPREQITAFRTFYQSATEPGLAFDGAPVGNIYPFDRSGKQLRDVLLYLPDGRPLTVGALSADPNRRYLVDQRGQRLYNSFPARYFDPGTLRVAHPDAGPRVKIPTILTPPLSGETP